MGMFDWVAIEVTCPMCGRPVKGFQTKDSECFLDRLVPGKTRLDDQLRYIGTYSTCRHVTTMDDMQIGDAFTTLDTLKEVEIYVTIPVNKDGMLSKDTKRYKVEYEVHNSGASVLGDKTSTEEVGRTNKQVVELEKKKHEIKIRILNEGEDYGGELLLFKVG